MEFEASENAEEAEFSDGQYAEERFAPRAEFASDFSAAETSPSGGGFWSFLFCTTGFFMAAGGVALATAPHFSWQLEKIGRQLSGMGLENGIFAVGGLVLFGIGLVYRAARTRKGNPAPQGNDGVSDLSYAVENLATDLALFRESILQVSSKVEVFGQQQAVFQEELRASMAEGGDDPSNPLMAEKNDAMFRLAASLDQLNARIDERMHHMDVQLRGHFDGMGEAIRENRDAMDTRMRTLSTQIQARAVTTEVPAHSDAPSLSDLAKHEEGLLARDSFQERDEIEIVVDLEDTEPPEPDDSTIEFFETIEQLDEMVSGSREPEAPTPSPAVDFDGLDLGELGLGNDPGEESSEPPPVRPAPEPREDELEALLPDDAVRRALDQNREDEH